jgi:hypothetical protein
MVTGDIEIVGTSREYREERLYILETLRRIEKKSDEQIEKAGASKEVAGKITTDLNRIGGNVRTLAAFKDTIERRVMRVEAKAMYIAAGAGALVAGAIELGKYLLAK